jgi:hypothetical protein
MNPKLEMLMQREQLMEDIDCIVDEYLSELDLPSDELVEMLMQREQLMEDIDCIVDEYLSELDLPSDELVKVLCDAVCRNFPSN